MDAIEIVALCAAVAWLVWGEWIARRAPRQLREMEQRLGAVTRYVEVTPAAYRDLDLAWYDRLQAELERSGYVFAGDYSAPEIRELRAFVRCMIARDGTTYCELTHVRFQGALRLFLLLVGGSEQRIVGFNTELSDGTFVSTENVRGPQLEPPPHVDREILPPNTEWRTLERRHGLRVVRRMRENTELRCVEMRTSQDVEASQLRFEEKRAAYRRATGFKQSEIVALTPKWNAQGAVETYTALLERRRRDREGREL